jgi:hypothetical protein
LIEKASRENPNAKTKAGTMQIDQGRTNLPMRENEFITMLLLRCARPAADACFAARHGHVPTTTVPAVDT